MATLALRFEEGWRGMWLGRSRCRSCGTTLGMRDLVPVLSWLAARGRCRHCGAPVSGYYPAVESGAAAIGLVSAALLDEPELALAALLGWWLLALALIDLRSWLAPDALTLPLILMGLAVAVAGEQGLLQGWPVTAGEAALGAAVGYGAFAALAWAYRKLRGREGMGLGDAKLLAAAGAWLGPALLPLVVTVAAGTGLVLALLAFRPLRADTAIPFATTLALAFWVVALANLAG